AIAAGADVPTVLQTTQAALLAGGFASVDYVELADAGNLEPFARLDDRPARLFVAARIGGTRLIDNMPVAAPGT
ncbi:MAG TPA: pantoate--beta-alanine ligase, partial [Croceibacterium sp.]|nr:pantoate--beta-alanine ligase [Croceibacterium sp.]